MTTTTEREGRIYPVAEATVDRRLVDLYTPNGMDDTVEVAHLTMPAARALLNTLAAAIAEVDARDEAHA